jgi:Flp pilus assembly protein TadD
MTRLLMIGKLMALLACGKATAAEIKVTNDDQHNEVYQRGSGLISPHMKLVGQEPKVSEKVRDQVSKGIADLNAVTTYNPNNWAAFWIKGKGYQVLGDQKAAKAEFEKSFTIQKENPDVAREYAASCLELGDGEEAVNATRHAIKLKPDDAGLRANLALALLISGKNEEAKTEITESLRMNPTDRISLAVKKVIDEVASGRRKQPKAMADLGR